MYYLERHDTRNFHGWILYFCHDGLEEEIFSTTSLQDAKEMLHDLTA